MTPGIFHIAMSHEGLFAVSSNGRLFHRVRDPKNFDGRNPDKWIWSEFKDLPGKVVRVVATPWNAVVVLLTDGKMFERIRDISANIASVPAYVWHEIESPILEAAKE